MQGPKPLWEGTILDDRYAVNRVIGRGGFGITYLCRDMRTGNDVAIKELAPIGATREEDNCLQFGQASPGVAERLRHQFTHEADVLARLRVPRVPAVLRTFHEHNTGYMVMEYVGNSRSLAQLQSSELSIPVELVESICDDLLETLGQIHQKGILHRDLTPHNVLLDADGVPHLIDFGSARQWHADMTAGHTVFFTPGYAPLEQLSERADRGPGTDLYGLAATAYSLLAGGPPPSAVDRLAGQELIPVERLRPDVSAGLAEMIRRGLEIQLKDRPVNALEMRDILSGSAAREASAESVNSLDDRRSRLYRFKFDSRQDPISGEPMESPRPLAADTCPVCREGKLKTRRLQQDCCPTCRIGFLRLLKSSSPITFCPKCTIGKMTPVKKGFLRKGPDEIRCNNCDFGLTKVEGGSWADIEGLARSEKEWRDLSGRAAKTMECDACAAQHDILPDGRSKRMTADTALDGYSTLYPEEWTRVAAGLNPGAGNTVCEQCLSDYFVEGDTITLLSDSGYDHYGFASANTGRLFLRSELPWLAVGKYSGKPGLVNPNSGTEFDEDPAGWKLVRTTSPIFGPHLDEVKSLEDWHRLAQGLPAVGQEEELEHELTAALIEGFRRGEIDFDPKAPHVYWRGKAVDQESGKTFKFELSRDGLTYGGLKRQFVDLADIRAIHAEEDDLEIRLGDRVLKWHIEPVEMQFKLESGRTAIVIGADDFAARFANLRFGRSPVA